MGIFNSPVWPADEVVSFAARILDPRVKVALFLTQNHS